LYRQIDDDRDATSFHQQMRTKDGKQIPFRQNRQQRVMAPSTSSPRWMKATELTWTYAKKK